MRTFKFLNKNNKLFNLAHFEMFSTEDKSTIAKGYYDAFDSHHNGHDLLVPYHPIDQENEYILWQMGADHYQKNPIPVI